MDKTLDHNNGRIVPFASSGHRASSSGRLMLPPPSLSPKKRSNTKNIATAEDYEQLRQHYTFVLPDKSQRDGRPSTWQERMVEQYHSHLYKEFALADLSVPGKIGFCFRTKDEVVQGLGYLSCGNLRCPSFQQPELYMNRKMAAQSKQLRGQGHAGPPYGEGLKDYEVPFRYEEHGEWKIELVKVRLCKVCVPLLLERAPGAKKKKSNTARKKATDVQDSDTQQKPETSLVDGQQQQPKESSSSCSSSSSESSSSADESDASGNVARRGRNKRMTGSEKQQADEGVSQSHPEPRDDKKTGECSSTVSDGSSASYDSKRAEKTSPGKPDTDAKALGKDKDDAPETVNHNKSLDKPEEVVPIPEAKPPSDNRSGSDSSTVSSEDRRRRRKARRRRRKDRKRRERERKRRKTEEDHRDNE
ncbi:Protein FRA10AC1 homolog [Seminavis robusta]|uniref:Protein FRA10AC1 homolog n=1 Tax=Seminavis robusta TaxID=568900 RepID=A0A9N8HZE7_9STRA|nr:Protein FRA10AC1 homolog [Seminavis robusta]|eukprot:Sro3501_g348670.1 Protein FRA10AC1 homolog (417) ;mRNA; f:2233-3483